MVLEYLRSVSSATLHQLTPGQPSVREQCVTHLPRAYHPADVSANLKNRVTKTEAQKALNALAGK